MAGVKLGLLRRNKSEAKLSENEYRIPRRWSVDLGEFKLSEKFVKKLKAAVLDEYLKLNDENSLSLDQIENKAWKITQNNMEVYDFSHFNKKSRDRTGHLMFDKIEEMREVESVLEDLEEKKFPEEIQLLENCHRSERIGDSAGRPNFYPNFSLIPQFGPKVFSFYGCFRQQDSTIIHATASTIITKPKSASGYDVHFRKRRRNFDFGRLDPFQIDEVLAEGKEGTSMPVDSRVGIVKKSFHDIHESYNFEDLSISQIMDEGVLRICYSKVTGRKYLCKSVSKSSLTVRI